MDFMLRDLLVCHPGLALKDAQRSFTHQQRLAVFRRDAGVCQLAIKCEGEKVRWDDWHCDHRLAWSEGGQTSVENGQVACAACNLSKGNAASVAS
jgi:5-methylcytosine-specific restriction endonuclease McrA